LVINPIIAISLFANAAPTPLKIVVSPKTSIAALLGDFFFFPFQYGRCHCLKIRFQYITTKKVGLS
ncbi:MAG: hypothetical protein ACPGU0_02455, partial [Marinirhabdus sp.]